MSLLLNGLETPGLVFLRLGACLLRLLHALWCLWAFGPKRQWQAEGEGIGGVEPIIFPQKSSKKTPLRLEELGRVVGRRVAAKMKQTGLYGVSRKCGARFSQDRTNNGKPKRLSHGRGRIVLLLWIFICGLLV